MRDAKAESVVDSRMAWFFLPESLKVFLVVDPVVGAQRVVLDDDRSATERYSDQKGASNDIRRRQVSEKQRFLSKYGVDYSSFETYDLVIDTSYATPQEVATLILSRAAQRAAQPEIWIAPRRLYPTQSIRELSRADTRYVAESVEKVGGLDAPMDLILIKDQFFIYNGHKRVSRAMQAGLPLVLGVIVASEGEELAPSILADHYVENECRVSAIYDWEEYHGFRFSGYPSECFKGSESVATR